MIVGIDIGTTNCKFLPEGHEKQSFPISYSKNVQSESHKEIDPISIVDNLIKCFAKLKSEKVTGVVVTGQMHGVLCWDENLNPTTNLITWEDTRCSQVFCDEVSNGGRLHPGYGIATLLWLRKHNSSCLTTAVAAGTIMDYIVARLTETLRPRIFGCWTQETSWTVDPVDNLLLDVATNLKDQTSTSTESNIFGIGSCKVLVGLGDHQCSVAGFGLPLEKNVLFLNFGTSAQMTFLSDKKVNENGSVEIRPFLDPKTSLVTVASMNGGNVLSAFVKAHGIEFSNVEEAIHRIVNTEEIPEYPHARFYPERCGLQGHGKLPLLQGQKSIEASVSLVKSLLANLKSLLHFKNEHFVLPTFEKIILSGGASRLFIPFLKDLGSKVEIADGDAASGAIEIFKFVQNNL